MEMRKIGILVSALSIAGVQQAGLAAPQKIRWAPYKSNLLNIQISLPADWKPVKITKALAFRYDDLAGGVAGIGILKSDRTGITIEQAADEEFEHAGKPSDWIRSNAKISGMRALKIVGLDPKNPDHKIVHYTVETPQGIYLIQCQATADRWATFSPIFSTILSNLKFL